MSPIYIDNIRNLAYLVCFFTDIKVRRVLECLAIFLLSKKMDQRILIKWCVKNKIKCSKAIETMTVAFGESTLIKKHVYKWYRRFTEGREDINDDTEISV